MKSEDYGKLLIESSFKESDNIWKRSTAFLAFQSVVLGFLANNIGSKPIASASIIILSFVGLIAAVFTFLVARVSEYYNAAWYEASRSWAASSAAREGGTENTEVWKHFAQHLESHDANMPSPKWHSTHMLKIFCIVLALIWAFILLYSWDARLRLGRIL